MAPTVTYRESNTTPACPPLRQMVSRVCHLIKETSAPLSPHMCFIPTMVCTQAYSFHHYLDLQL